MKISVLEIGKVIKLFCDKRIKGPIEHVFMLEERREKETIENMKAYVKAVDPVLAELRKNGATDVELQLWRERLHMPVIDATLACLVARRHKIVEELKPANGSTEAAKIRVVEATSESMELRASPEQASLPPSSTQELKSAKSD